MINWGVEGSIFLLFGQLENALFIFAVLQTSPVLGLQKWTMDEANSSITIIVVTICFFQYLSKGWRFSLSWSPFCLKNLEFSSPIFCNTLKQWLATELCVDKMVDAVHGKCSKQYFFFFQLLTYSLYWHWYFR